MNKVEAEAFLKGFIQRDLLGSLFGEFVSPDFKEAKETIGEENYMKILEEQVALFKSNHI